MKTLGLDLGSNSLGWAVVDDAGGIVLDKGVVVFPDGIDPANDTLETPAAIRRAARMSRRMKFRRKMRKWHLLKILIGHGMCPLSIDELAHWQRNGKYPVANHAFIGWLKSSDTSNPYSDRAAAAEGKVEPLTLGRALYHICQRRGFKSSRKDAVADTGDESADSKNTAKKLGAVGSDIAALTKEIADAGCRTLGQYFFRRLEAEKGALAKTRIRGRYTGRIEHYQTEFTVIMDAQGIKPDDPLRTELYKAIFMQRPLRSQKHLVGMCPLEPACPRAQIAHPLFEEYRMLAFVNNLSFVTPEGEKVPLTADDRALACKAFMKAAPSFKFGDISKLFKKDPRFKNDGYAFHHYRDDETVSSCSLRHRLRTAFGDTPFDEQMVFDALSFFDDDDKLRAWLHRHFPTLDEKGANRVAAIHPREGNANYSLKAIRLILPFLRRGYELSQARFCAKLPKIVKGYAAHEEEILRNLAEIKFEYQADKERLADETVRKTSKLEPLFDRYRRYLLEKWGVTEEEFAKLYLHGDSVYEAGRNGRIPTVQLGMIRNPLVQRSMTTLRRLVNYLRDHGKIDADTVIRIELARNVNDFATRKAWQAWQKSRRLLRENAATEIAKAGGTPGEDAIDRYLLWEEQGHKCLYTDKSISLADMLAGNAFDIEHTVPRSKSGDDSLANKTLCEARYNRQVKKGGVPRQCPNWDEIDVRLAPWREKLEELEKNYRNQSRAARAATEPDRRSAARIKALTTRFELDYWRDKLRRFDVEPDRLQDAANGLNGFKRRQLVDTGVMCTHAVELLRSVYPAVYSVNGSATAFARKAWGIQGDEAKDRSEHTHHAKDAMVIAALTPARFTAICTALKDDGGDFRRPCDVCSEPWPGFADRVREATDEILVKHVLRQTTLRQSSKRIALAKAHPPKDDPNGKPIKYANATGDTVRGPLHKDTFYGCIHKPGEDKRTFVVRKSLVGPIPAALTLVDKIVDPAIRALVRDQLETLKGSGVKNVEPGMIRMASGVPVNKVRIVAHTTDPAQLRDHAMVSDKDYKTPYYVTSAEGSNFRLAIFDIDGKKSVVPDNSLDWAQKHKSPDYVPLDRREGFVGYIVPGAMAVSFENEGDLSAVKQRTVDLQKRLYKVVKFRSDGLITFRFHREARASVILAQDLLANGKHRAGESKIDYNHPHELLLVSPGIYLDHMLFEGIDFRMMLDGTIKFLN